MFGSSPRGANAYAQVGVETGVVAASPHQLIVMLFDGAITAIQNGLDSMQAGNIEAKGNAISKAIMIIDNGLRASLNKDVGGQIAENLDSLYEYMSRRLLTANLRNDSAMLQEVLLRLQDLKSAWSEIGASSRPAPQEAPPPPEAQSPAGYDALSPRSTTFVSA